MKNIAKFLMVAFLVIVATFSVSAVTVELSLEALEDYENVYNLQCVTITDDVELYNNAFEVNFNYNSNTMQLYSTLDEMVIPSEDLVDFWADAVEMGPGATRKHTHDPMNPKFDGDYVTIQMVSHAASASVLKRLPQASLHVWNIAFYIEGDVSSLTADDFSVNYVYLNGWDGVSGGETGEYACGSWAEPVDSQIELINNVAAEGGSEEPDEPAGPTVDETLTTTEDKFIDVCPVYKTNFATPADEYGFIGALDTIEDAAFVCGAEGVISGVVESTEAGEYTVIVKGVPSGESVKVRPYYCVEGNYFYGAVVTYTAA